VRDIFAGVVLIAIGLALGGSIFRGDFSLSSIFFDGLGLFFIVKGILHMVRAKRDGRDAAGTPPAGGPR
jgi:hypothetical protein